MAEELAAAAAAANEKVNSDDLLAKVPFIGRDADQSPALLRLGA